METKKAPRARGKTTDKRSIAHPAPSLHDIVGDAHSKACESAWALIVDALTFQAVDTVEVILREVPLMEEPVIDAALEAIRNGARAPIDLPDKVQEHLISDMVTARQIRDRAPYLDAIHNYTRERKRYDLSAQYGHALRAKDARAREEALAGLLALEHEGTEDNLLSVTASKMLTHPPAPDRILIHDLLIRGGVMCLAGQSKAGKSCALVQMALAMTAGGKLFGRFECEPSTVVLVDLESTPAILHKKITTALGFGQFKGWLPADTRFLDRLRILTLNDIMSATTRTIDTFARRDNARHGAADALIVDPLYLIDSQDAGRDENAASDTTRLLAGLRAAAAELEASLIYSHHFSKGSQASRDFWDRASGSGVHARFAFCLATLTPLEDGGGVLFEAITRGWRAPDPFSMRFNWPCFEADATLGERLKGAPGRPHASGTNPDQLAAIIQEKGNYSEGGFMALHLKDLADVLRVSDRTTRRRCEEAGLEIKCGFVLVPQAENIGENDDEIPFE